jgi:hypothetical protein
LAIGGNVRKYLFNKYSIMVFLIPSSPSIKENVLCAYSVLCKLRTCLHFVQAEKKRRSSAARQLTTPASGDSSQVHDASTRYPTRFIRRIVRFYG